MMTADDNDEPLHPDLIPEDHAEAMRRFEAVRTFNPAALAGLEKRDILLAWWSFCWLHAALHSDDADVWPEEVAVALSLAAEVFRRYEAAEIADGETTPPKLSTTASGTSGPRATKINPNHTQTRTRPKHDRSDRHSRMREGGPVWENSPPFYGAVFL